MTVKIDEAKVFRLIEENKPRAILVNAPGGLLNQTKVLMERVREKYGVTCILAGDSCFGICDTVDDDAPKLQADIAMHIGHNAVVQQVGEFTYLIDAVDDVKFDAVIEKAARTLRGHRRLGLATFSQHMHELEPAKRILEREGYEVVLGRRNDLLMASQVFGCDFSTIYPMREDVDAFCFLGESEFHAV